MIREFLNTSQNFYKALRNSRKMLSQIQSFLQGLSSTSGPTNSIDSQRLEAEAEENRVEEIRLEERYKNL